MSTFSGVARILGVVVPRLPRIGWLALQANSSLGSGQRRAAAAFHKTLLSQGVPAELAATLAAEYPRLNVRDLLSGLQLGQHGRTGREHGQR
ncbi:MAG: hypothetical protein ACM3XN_09635 [Chloroflexota bacterium]